VDASRYSKIMKELWVATYQFRLYREQSPDYISGIKGMISITLQQYWIEVGDGRSGRWSMEALIRESRGEWRTVPIIDAPNDDPPKDGGRDMR
jgi:hypothetical protein